MKNRRQAREETRFLRGDIGIDGQSTHEEETKEESPQAQLFRSRTWLGREFLTWLLWKSESTEELCTHEGHGVRVLFLDRVTLRGIKGEVSEITLKGKTSPYAEECRHALANGLLVHQARVKVSIQEREWEASLDAEHLDVRSAKIPQLMSEEDDARLTERLELAEKLSGLLHVLIEAFLEVRAVPAWRKKVVPQMQDWMRDSRRSLSKVG